LKHRCRSTANPIDRAMATSSSPHSWVTPWRRRAPTSSSDWADLGTAFGLDLSMAAEAPAGDASASPSSALPQRRWWQRLNQGRGSRR
jgi:hypothetical protein